ncbi:MAG: Gfo/Idh/MocA family protein, partial [Sphaerospermopsis kisseleviana]
MKQVIVVGAGNWGKNLIHNFYNLGALDGVAEMNPDLRQQVESKYPQVKTYTDFAGVLESDVSAVVLATPAPTHYQLAMTALKAGKDVFVEKPMTLRTQEAKALAEYADQ